MELLQVDTLEETFQKLESYARGDGPRGAGRKRSRFGKGAEGF